MNRRRLLVYSIGVVFVIAPLFLVAALIGMVSMRWYRRSLSAMRDSFDAGAATMRAWIGECDA